MDGRPSRTRKTKRDTDAARETQSEDVSRPLSHVDPADLAELESLAGSPGQFDLSAIADRSHQGDDASDTLRSDGVGTTGSSSAQAERLGAPKYKMDKKLIKESLSIAYSFILTITDKASKGVVPGNRMNDLIATRPGYQARLDNLLMAVAEEYGCSEYIPTPVALLLFTATVYSEAQTGTTSGSSNPPQAQSSSSAAPRTLS